MQCTVYFIMAFQSSGIIVQKKIIDQSKLKKTKQSSIRVVCDDLMTLMNIQQHDTILHIWQCGNFPLCYAIICNTMVYHYSGKFWIVQEHSPQIHCLAEFKYYMKCKTSTHQVFFTTRYYDFLFISKIMVILIISDKKEL